MFLHSTTNIKKESLNSTMKPSSRLAYQKKTLITSSDKNKKRIMYKAAKGGSSESVDETPKTFRYTNHIENSSAMGSKSK
jgi:hypothetical protein